MLLGLLAGPSLASGPFRLGTKPVLGFQCGESPTAREVACAWRTEKSDDGGNDVIQLHFSIWSVETGQVIRAEQEELEVTDDEATDTAGFARGLSAEIDRYLTGKRFVSAGKSVAITLRGRALRATVDGQAVARPLPALKDAEANLCCRASTAKGIFFSATRGLLAFVGYECGQSEDEDAPCVIMGGEWTESQQFVTAVGGPPPAARQPAPTPRNTPAPGITQPER